MADARSREDQETNVNLERWPQFKRVPNCKVYECEQDWLAFEKPHSGREQKQGQPVVQIQLSLLHVSCT